jgi:hypothetical protein
VIYRVVGDELRVLAVVDLRRLSDLAVGHVYTHLTATDAYDAVIKLLVTE